MSTQTGHGPVPEWTRGDRLRKARVSSGYTTRDFAKAIGVSQKTVTDAEGDKRDTRKVVLNAWSLATGVPVEWLEHGIAPGPTPDPGNTQDDSFTISYPKEGALLALPRLGLATAA